MGLADMLIKMELAYGSEESLSFIEELYKFICVEAYAESCDLAKEKGSFSLFDAEKLLESGFMKQMPEEIRQKVREQGLRNVTLLTQAPTGTTGTMVNTSTGIERVKVYDDWIRENPGAKKPDYFVSAMDLAPEGHVKVQAAIQKWVDSSISKTGNTPKEYTIEQTGKLYELLYDLGCKGGTTYRDGSRDTQVLTVKKEEKKEAPVVTRSSEPKARIRSTVLRGTTYRKVTPIGTAYITVNCDGPDPSDIFEVFINVAKVGSDVAADAEGLGRLISLLLRMPSPLTPDQRAQAIISQLSGIGSGRSMGFGRNRVMSLPDAVAQVLQQHIGSTDSDRDASRLPDEDDEEDDDGQLDLGLPSSGSSVKPDICPVCGNVTFVNIEGCKKCFSCGYSEC
jgi:ribonucleoside-diphosphate reductase alpha chain